MAKKSTAPAADKHTGTTDSSDAGSKYQLRSLLEDVARKARQSESWSVEVTPNGIAFTFVPVSVSTPDE